MRSRVFQRCWRSWLLALAMMSLGTPLWATKANIHWPRIEVDARLDADGRLHVSERWTIVFNGEWNGGERFFKLRLGQTVKLRGLRRIDPLSGESVALIAGSLDSVDQYEWTHRHWLRWRSRLATDPGFDNETFHYVLEYTLSGLLFEVDGGYRLDHDFAFKDRVGTIDRFVVALELDPVWRATTPLPKRIELDHLLPSDNMPLVANLAFQQGRPSTVLTHTPIGFRVGVFAAALAMMAWLVVVFRQHEAARGRFDAVDCPASLDRRWLQEHLLQLRPEEAGALWNRRVGPTEVAATVARLVAAGKLESRVEKVGRKKRTLVLGLLADRSELDGYERLLIDKLFFDGRTQTDTEAVRKHYRVQGFDPAGLIRPQLETRLVALRGPQPKPPSSRITWLLWLLVLAALVGEGMMRGERVLLVIALMCLAGLLPIIPGFCFVARYRRRTRQLGRAMLGFVVPALALLVVSWGAVLQIRGLLNLMPGVFGVAALAILPAALLSLWLHLARTGESSHGVRRHHQLAAIRRSFVAQLERPQPNLDDAWFPYLLALGLEKDVDDWLAHHGVAIEGSSLPSWTGGGGAFGGATGLAGWGPAAAGLTSGVAIPSTHGSGDSFGGSYPGGGAW